MDFIKLERIEPFKQANAKPKPPPASRVTTFNNVAYKYQHGEVNGLFQKLRTKTCEPQPIPPQVIPVMAFNEQVEKYEKNFLGDSKLVDGLTIQSLMRPFGDADAAGGKNSRYGKFLFLTRFFLKLIHQNMNYDCAVSCSDRTSEETLFKALSTVEFNVRTMSSMFDKKLFGVMVKIRKNIQSRNQYTPITRNSVDAVFVYDSACGVNVDNIMRLLRGVRFEDPILFFLACMDTAEIRIHTYNRSVHNSKIPLRWDTRVCDLDHDLQQLLLLQPNRLPEHVAAIAWNDHLSQTLLNWVSDKNNILYKYKLPTKGGLLNEVNTFLLHHPSVPSTLPAIHTDVEAIQASVRASARASLSAATQVAQPNAKAIVWAAKDARPDARNIRPDSSIFPVGKSVIPTVKASGPRAAPPVPRAAPPASKTAKSSGNTSSPPAMHTAGGAMAVRPPAAPAGIHPERMAMIGGTSPLPSVNQMDTTKRKKGRDSPDRDNNSRAKKLAKMPANAADSDTSMEDAQDNKATRDSITEEIGDTSKRVETAAPDNAGSSSSNAAGSDESTLASDFANSFNAFFTNALQKFEDEILNIKF